MVPNIYTDWKWISSYRTASELSRLWSICVPPGLGVINSLLWINFTEEFLFLSQIHCHGYFFQVLGTCHSWKGSTFSICYSKYVRFAGIISRWEHISISAEERDEILPVNFMVICNTGIPSCQLVLRHKKEKYFFNMLDAGQ